MQDFTIIVIGLASVIVGLVQMTKAALHDKGEMQEEKNEELLEIERRVIRCDIEKEMYLAQRDEAILRARKLNKAGKALRTRYDKLIEAVNMHVPPSVIEKVREEVKQEKPK
jgi:hypothetical protein